MNIFVLDENPEVAAQYHLDKHCVKQILETYQMLGSAVIRHGATPDQMPLTKAGTPLRGGYKHHPVTKWVGDNIENFLWAVKLGESLCKEYTRRYHKVHSCQAGIEKLKQMRGMIPKGSLTPFAVAINDEQTCRDRPLFNQLSVVEKYRQYYIYDKAYMAKWTNREVPAWFACASKSS